MRRQRGFTLLLLLLLLVSGALALFLAARDQGAGARLAREQGAVETMATVRDALVAHAVSDNNRPGALPCASPGTDGTSSLLGGTCGADVGRFAYRTMDMRPPRDAQRYLLWYALDPEYRDASGAQPLNPQAEPGALTLDGRPNHVAVVIAPGDAVAGQDRRTDTRADFLEGTNQSGDDYVSCEGVAGCNDVVRGLTSDEVFDPVQRRVLEAVAAALRELWVASDPTPGQRFLPYPAAFGSTECDGSMSPPLIGRLPTADAVDDCDGEVLAQGSGAHSLPDWVYTNDWLDLVVYHLDPQCSQAVRNCTGAALTLDADAGLSAVLAAAGRPLGTQARPGTGVGDYLEDSENTDADSAYAERPLGPGDNDVLRGVALP